MVFQLMTSLTSSTDWSGKDTYIQKFNKQKNKKHQDGKMVALFSKSMLRIGFKSVIHVRWT